MSKESDVKGVALFIEKLCKTLNSSTVLLGKITLFLIVWIVTSVFIKIYFANKKPNCPKCGCNVGRVSRKFGDRLLGKIFLCKIRRYSCDNCGWEGLRLKRSYAVKRAL